MPHDKESSEIDVLFAISSGVGTVVLYVVVGLITAGILGFSRAVMKFMQGKQTKVRQNADAQRVLSEFLFDTPSDPIAKTPARIGWTTQVNDTLAVLTTGQAKTSTLLNEVLYELKPNGGKNFRGIVENGVKASEAEVVRIRKNEDDANGPS